MKYSNFSRVLAVLSIATQLPLASLSAFAQPAPDVKPASDAAACKNKPISADSDVASGALGDILDQTEKSLDAEALQIRQRNSQASSVDATVKLKNTPNGVDVQAPANKTVALAPGVLSRNYIAEKGVQAQLGRTLDTWVKNPAGSQEIRTINQDLTPWVSQVYSSKYGSARGSKAALDALRISVVCEALRAKMVEYTRNGDQAGADKFGRELAVQLTELHRVRAKLPKPEDPKPEPVVQTPDPVVKTPDPVVKTPDPVVKTPDPVVKTPDPVVKTPDPVVKTPDPVVKTPDPVVKTPDPVNTAPGKKPVPDLEQPASDWTTAEIVSSVKEVPTFVPGVPWVTLREKPEGPDHYSVELAFNCDCLRGLFKTQEEIEGAIGKLIARAQQSKRYKGISALDHCCLCGPVVAKIPVGEQLLPPGGEELLPPGDHVPSPGTIVKKDEPICEPVKITEVKLLPPEWPMISRKLGPIPTIPPLKLDAVWDKEFVLWPAGNSKQGITLYAGSTGVLAGKPETQFGIGYARQDEFTGVLTRQGRLIDPLDNKVIQPGDSRFPSDGINMYSQPVVEYNLSGTAMGSLRMGNQDGVNRFSPTLEAYYSGILKPNAGYPFSRTSNAMSPVGLYAATYINWSPFLQNNKNAAFIGGLGGDIGLGDGDYVRPFVGVATHTFSATSDATGLNGHHRGALAAGVDLKYGSLMMKSYYAQDPYDDDLQSNASATVLANYTATRTIDLWGIYNYATNNADARNPGASGSAVRMGMNWYFGR